MVVRLNSRIYQREKERGWRKHSRQRSEQHKGPRQIVMSSGCSRSQALLEPRAVEVAGAARETEE